MNKIYKTLISLSILVLPFLANAQLATTRTLLANIEDIVRITLIPLVFSLALLYFFYGVAKFIWGSGDGKAEGKSIMVWGLVALFVISSVWGIIYFVRSELAIDNDINMPIPTIGKPGT